MHLRTLIRRAAPGAAAALASFATYSGPPPAPAPAASGCSAPEYRQFDFWLGQWEVTSAGKPAGHSDIQADLDGCAVLETWTSVGASRGRSINFFDASTHRWHQTWIDNQGGPLQLDGGLINGSMVLSQSQKDPASGQVTVNRITWTPNADGSVRQHWESRTGNAAWQNVFDGRYVRAAR